MSESPITGSTEIIPEIISVSSVQMTDAQLYEAIRKIREVILSFRSNRLWTDGDGHWRGGNNSFYDHTKAGLLLEYYYGLPNKVWTPWGYQMLFGGGSGNWDVVQPALCDRLGLSLHREEYNSSMGTYGPWFKVSKVDGLILPEPVLFEPGEPRPSYEECNQRFREVVTATGHQADHPNKF